MSIVLPNVKEIEAVGVTDAIIVFEEAFELESLLQHASDYLKRIFNDDFRYEKTNLMYGCMYGRGDITEAYGISNGKDWKDGDGVLQDGAHFRLLYDIGRMKCCFENTGLRWNKIEQLTEWYTSTVEPLDALCNPLHHVIDRLVFDRFIWTLPNGREVYKKYRGSKLVKN